MTSFHVPLARGWNAERTRQLIAMYRFSRSSGESIVVPAGARVDRFPGAVRSSASLARDAGQGTSSLLSHRRSALRAPGRGTIVVATGRQPSAPFHRSKT